MSRENIYISLITLFFIWGGIGLINPKVHRKVANLSFLWLGLSGVLVISAISFEMFTTAGVLLFGFAQALAITASLSFLLIPILVDNKSIIAYFSPFWYLLVTIILIATLIFPAAHEVRLSNWTFELHFLLSMFAYAMFTIWAIVAIVVIVQSGRLHHPQSVEKIRQLPPLLSIEKQSLWIGRITFLFLSAVLFTGIVYSNISIGKILLTHKFIFAWITWIGVCIIIFGQFFYNWRGKWVNYSILICYAFVFLAYIGYRFVLEIILNRGF